MKANEKRSQPRRDFLKAAATSALALGSQAAGFSSLAWAAGSDKPEIEEIKLGFIPLTDCASVVIAAVKGFDKKYGIRIKLSKEASWAAVRDKILNAELHASHLLYGLVYGLHMGTGAQKTDMAILACLNQNGQAITLAKALHAKGVSDGPSLRKYISSGAAPLTFAQTFPTGTHAMWLNYWLAAQGINPLQEVKNIVVPPPQMVANMRIGAMDGYCVGEPWNARAISDGIGFTVTTTQDIWPDHPEKVLAARADFVQKHPNAARALTAAVIDASRYIDQSENRSEVAQIIAAKSYVNAPLDVIKERFLGTYDNGIGKRWQDKHSMKFFDDGQVGFPYLSDGMWFLTQLKRWGFLSTHPDYLKVASEVNRIDLYKQAADLAKASVPKSPLRSSKLIDGIVWDGSKPEVYAQAFKIMA